MAVYYVTSTGSNTAPYDTWAKAATSIQTVIDALSGGGNTVYCMGSEQAGATIDFDNATSGGVWESPNKFIGVNTGTTNEPPIAADMGTNRYSIDANSGNYPAGTCNGAMDYFWLVNIEFKNSGNSHGLLFDTDYTEYCLFVNCRFTGNASYGIYSNTLLRTTLLKQCIIDTNAGGGFYRPGAGCHLVACNISDNTGKGIELFWEINIVGGTITGNTTIGIQDFYSSLYVGVVIDGMSTAGADGIRTYGASGALYLGVRVTNINDREIDVTAGSEAFVDYLYTDGTITETAEVVCRVPDKTMTTHITESGSDTNDGYVTDELNLDTGATYRSEALEIPSA